jgi:hypothetical protein
MHGAAISANPLKLDVRSHKKCLFMCAIATISTFQYGERHKQYDEKKSADRSTGLDYALVGGFMA